MGKDVAARFKMITENAGDIGELDDSFTVTITMPAERTSLDPDSGDTGVFQRTRE